MRAASTLTVIDPMKNRQIDSRALRAQKSSRSINYQNISSQRTIGEMLVVLVQTLKFVD